VCLPIAAYNLWASKVRVCSKLIDFTWYFEVKYYINTIALRGMRLSCICVGLCHFSALSKNVRIRSIGHVSLPAKRYRERIIVNFGESASEQFSVSLSSVSFRFCAIRFIPFLSVSSCKHYFPNMEKTFLFN
jgi:hypothetical protein